MPAAANQLSCSEHECSNRNIWHRGYLELSGVAYNLSTNFPGGHGGMGKGLWQTIDCDRGQITPGITQPDGDMGFPGKLEVQG